MAHRQAILQLTHRTIGRSNRKHRDTQGITDGQTESETVEGRKRRKATTMRKKRMCGGRNTLKLFQSKACISGKHTATNTRKIHLLNAPLFARLVPVQFTDIQFHFLEKHKPVGNNTYYDLRDYYIPKQSDLDMFRAKPQPDFYESHKTKLLALSTNRTVPGSRKICH